MTPPMPTTPAPGFCRKRIDDRLRLGDALPGVGVNTSLMIGTCAGWMAIFPVKPSRRRLFAFAAKTVAVAEIDIDGVDRRHLRGRRAGEAERPRQPVGIEETALRIAVGLGAKLGGKVLGAPGRGRKAARWRRHKCRRETSAAAVSVAIGDDLDVAVGQAADAPRAPQAWRRACTIEAPPSAFGSMTASGFAAHDGIEIGVGEAGLQAVDAHEEIGPRRCRHRLLEKRRRALSARASLPSRAIESSRSTISASAPLAIALSSFFATVGGDEEERAHGDDPVNGMSVGAGHSALRGRA